MSEEAHYLALPSLIVPSKPPAWGPVGELSDHPTVAPKTRPST
jgi:hypothetical protein